MKIMSNMLKQKIQTDFITAMKNKDDDGKRALSGIKSKITEAEKLKGNVELSDDDVIKVIISAIKQRNQSTEEFTNANRLDLANRELSEIKVLETYLPKQMTLEEIENSLKTILEEFEPGTNKQKLVGQTIGTFNKRFMGKADNKLVKEIVEKLTSEIV